MLSATLFVEMLRGKNTFDLEALIKQHGKKKVSAFIALLHGDFWQALPLLDDTGRAVEFTPSRKHTGIACVPAPSHTPPSLAVLASEMLATLTLDGHTPDPQSVQAILKGVAPQNSSQYPLLALKRAFEYILSTRLTVETLAVAHHLVIDALGDVTTGYRTAAQYVPGSKITHMTMDGDTISAYMAQLVDFANTDDSIDVFTKSCILHAYLLFLHPYPTENGRMARLVQQWYVWQHGYSISVSTGINSEYLDQLLEKITDNQAISGALDVTPFIYYYWEAVFNRLPLEIPKQYQPNTAVQSLLTEKESVLYEFILTHYQGVAFTTKQLEHDFGQCAYATIRSFVLKLDAHGVLDAQHFGNKVKYTLL